MRYVALLIVLLAAPALAQTPEPVTIPTEAEWVGPLEFQDSRGKHIVPTRATIRIKEGAISGDWHGVTRSRPSGEITGAIDDRSRMTLSVTIFSAASIDREDGSREVIATERCQGTARFTGTITAAGVFRWTANKAAFDTPVKRLQDRHCEDITRLIWTLQPHQP